MFLESILLKPNNIICHWVYNGGDGNVFLVVAIEIGCGTFFLVEVIVRLNLINHLVGFIPCQICLYFSN